MRVTISGPPGSGKTTVAELVANSLKLELIVTGQIFRDNAKKAGMDVLEYNRLAERDSSIDKELDDEIVRQASELDNIVVEGRLAGQLLHRAQIASIKVFVTAPLSVRAGRIANREKTDLEDEQKVLVGREESERIRYLAFYDIDIGDLSIYDLVIDSSELTAEEVAGIVVDEIKKMEP